MQNVVKTITEHPEMFLIIAGVILLIILVLLVRKLFRKPKHNVEEYQDTVESASNQENEELSESENEEEYKQIPDEQSRQNHIKDYDEDDSVEDTREYRADEFNEENDSEPLKDSQEDDDVSMQMHAKRREPREWEKQTEEPSEEEAFRVFHLKKKLENTECLWITIFQKINLSLQKIINIVMECTKRRKTTN